jgi:hypothetical protein
MPATGGREAKPSSPFVAGTVIVAYPMSFRAKDQWPSLTVGCCQGDVQRASTCHPPNDLQFVTTAWRNMSRPKSKTPNLAVDARSVEFVRRAVGAKWRRCGTRCTPMRCDGAM